jgi:hypothetical protein
MAKLNLGQKVCPFSAQAVNDSVPSKVFARPAPDDEITNSLLLAAANL